MSQSNPNEQALALYAALRCGRRTPGTPADVLSDSDVALLADALRAAQRETHEQWRRAFTVQCPALAVMTMTRPEAIVEFVVRQLWREARQAGYEAGYEDGRRNTMLAAHSKL